MKAAVTLDVSLVDVWFSFEHLSHFYVKFQALLSQHVLNDTLNNMNDIFTSTYVIHHIKLRSLVKMTSSHVQIPALKCL